MGECLFARRGAIHTPPFVPKQVFADNTWAEIVHACRRNKVPASWAIGDQKRMTIAGADYAIDIIGKNHDDYADGSGKAPLTFQLHDCYNKRDTMNSLNSNVGGWTTSRMRTVFLPEVKGLLPMEVQAGIREIYKLTSIGDAKSSIETTVDTLFLLSEAEVLSAISNSFPGEGSRYEYYSKGNASGKYLSGVPTFWWTRSPRNVYNTQFCHIDTSYNDYSAVSSAGASLGVAFAFCF